MKIVLASIRVHLLLQLVRSKMIFLDGKLRSGRRVFKINLKYIFSKLCEVSQTSCARQNLILRSRKRITWSTNGQTEVKTNET